MLLPHQENLQTESFMMIWVHKGMTAKGASEPQMQMDASSGLPQANEQQSR